MSDSPLNAALLAIVTRLEGIEDRLGGIEAGQSATNDRLDGIEAGQATTNGRLDRMEAEQTRLRVDVLSRLDGIGGRLTEVREDIVVNMARANRALEATNDMSVELMSLWRQVKRQGDEIRELRDGKP